VTFRLQDIQKRELVRYVRVPPDLQPDFFGRTEAAIADFIYWQAAQQGKQGAKAVLEDLRQLSAALMPLLQSLFLRNQDPDTGVYVASTLLHDRVHEQMDVATMQSRCGQLIQTLEDLQRTAEQSLASEMLNENPNETSAAVELVERLGAIYREATGKTPGSSRNTTFARYVQYCMRYGGHRVKDAHPYIKAACRRHGPEPDTH